MIAWMPSEHISPEDKWARMCARFLDDLKPQINELEAFVDRYRNASDVDGDDVANAAMIAHKIRGTAGTFGLSEVGNACARFEETLRLVINQSVKWSTVAPDIERIMHEIIEANDPNFSPPTLAEATGEACEVDKSRSESD
jgi:HPt (histidine-containing phosphotransfer) domain-containing protein